MQGIIFTLFADMVVEKFGMEIWNDVLAEANVDSEGAYTTGRTYDDAEMHALLRAFCRKTQLDADTAMHTFGKYTFPHLIAALPDEEFNLKTFPELLQSIDSVIHAEVRRLNPDAMPPSIQCKRIGPDVLNLHYRSHRGMCAVCEGILHGAAEHYGLHITTNHVKCQHRGDDECVFEIHGGTA